MLGPLGRACDACPASAPHDPVPRAWPRPCLSPFRQGVGCNAACLPPLPRAGQTDAAAPPAAEDGGGFIGFFKNGVWQGRAFLDPAPGVYRPSISLYTNPLQQAEPARVAVNFGAGAFAAAGGAEALQQASGSPAPVQAISALVVPPPAPATTPSPAATPGSAATPPDPATATPPQ